MSHGYFNPPTAPENNPPINPQYFQPSLFYISAITLGANTTITTSVNHNYVVGQQVRLLIPSLYGCQGLSGQEGQVIFIPAANQVIVNINSIGINSFITSPSYGSTKPQIAAIGDVNSGNINSAGRIQNGTTIPGTFINISPL